MKSLTISIIDQSVDRIFCDVSALGIQCFHGQGIKEIRIEGRFILKSQRHSLTLDPEEPAKLGDCLQIIGKKILSVEISGTGILEIILADSSSITVEPLSDYESWQLVCSDEQLLICTPGGDVARWSGDK